MKRYTLNYSLPFRILMTSFLLLIIPLLIFAAFEMKTAYEEHLIEAKNDLITTARDKAGELAQVTSSKILLLKKVSILLDLPALLPQLPNQKTNQIMADLVNMGGIWGIAVYKIANGRFVSVASNDTDYVGLDFTDLLLVTDVLSEKEVVLLIDYKFDGRPLEELVMASILIESDHETLGVFSMAFDITKLLKNLLKPQFKPYKMQYALVSRYHFVFEASDPRLRFQLFKSISAGMRDMLIKSAIYDGNVLAETPLQVSEIPHSEFFEFEFDGRKQLAYQIAIPNSRMTLVSYVAANAISLQILYDFIPIFAIFCAIFIFGGFIVFLLTKLMARPLHMLAGCMEDVKNNNFQTRYQQTRFGFEINHLGEIFNEMLLSMRDHMKRAEDERAKREAIALELKIGHDVQRQILPQSMPSYPKVEIADCYISAKEVSGDFYDVFIQEAAEGQRLFFTVADTSGKGISACLYSLGARSLIRGFGKETRNLSTLVNRVNKNFYESAGSSGMFVTAFVGTFDQLTEQLTYISCGHNPPLIKRKNGEVALLENHGMALGFLESLNLRERSLPFQEGEILIIYTDGITEAQNENLEFFGLERLIEFFREQNAQQSAQEMVEGLIKRINEFTLSSVQYDDMTLLIIKRM